MTQAETNKRLTKGLQDMAEYCSFRGAREQAADILDFDKPLKLSAPKKLTGNVE